MLPWTQRGSTRLAGGEELSLWQRGSEFVVRAGSAELMSTRRYASEEALAEHGCVGLPAEASVFIGGLGLGYTLQAALAALAPGATVLVAELVPAVVDWVRDVVGRGGCLDDPRVSLVLQDAAVVLREARGRFHSIVLDIDNGPTPLTQAANAWLYSTEGLHACAGALRDRGRLLVWSAATDPRFELRMRDAGFEVRTVPVAARRSHGQSPAKGPRHSIFIGIRGTRRTP
jgi:spermidine synthase